VTLLYELRKLKAERHWRKARDEDLSGVNHVITTLKHPEHGNLALACACGEVFWCNGIFRGELVKREDYESAKSYRRALHAQFGVKSKDVTSRKAKKLRGLNKKGNKR